LYCERICGGTLGFPFFISSCGPTAAVPSSDWLLDGGGTVKRTDPPNDETLEDVLMVVMVARLLILVVQAEAAMITLAVTRRLRNMLICLFEWLGRWKGMRAFKVQACLSVCGVNQKLKSTHFSWVNEAWKPARLSDVTTSRLRIPGVRTADRRTQ
jgi:hypothetical protein